VRVWVYPEKKYEELGARRWVAEWDELRPGCKAKDTTQENDEFDYDRDLIKRSVALPNKDDAIAAANRVLESGAPFFGVVEVQEQVVDWYVEGDRIAHWDWSGDPVEVS
jgi:hypothetical protein